MNVELCPTCSQPIKRPDLDGRAVKWRTRTRIYDRTRLGDEPAADTDPDLSPELKGTTVLVGLPMVACEVRELAHLFHSGQGSCVGLEQETLLHKLKGLRPTLSRRGGNAVWRLPYTVAGREWLVRVDIERVEATNG